MTIHFRVVDDVDIEGYSMDLREIERSILYPLSESGDQFTIAHGQDYQGFFTRMGKTRFILAMDNDKVCGIAAFTWKKVIVKGQCYTGLYLADMKLAKPYRGKKVMQRMIAFGFLKWITRRRYQGWDFIFGAAMSDGATDVTRSFRGLHLGKLGRTSGLLDIYFCSPEKLANLVGNGPPYPAQDNIARLSTGEETINDNTGLKECRLVSTGKPWPLIHLPFPVSCWAGGLGRYLRDCAQRLQQPSQYPDTPIACFALDRKLSAHQQWLAENSIKPGAICTLYDWSVPILKKPVLSCADYLHLSTSEI